MVLIRALYFIASKANFECRLLHVPGVLNVAADLLSRDEHLKFGELFPNICDLFVPVQFDYLLEPDKRSDIKPENRIVRA